MKSIYLRNFVETAVMVAICFLIIAVAFVGIGRSYIIDEYRDNMENSAGEVSRIASAIAQNESLNSWALGMSLGGPTGYAMNPARDLGPRIAHAILPIAGKGGSDWAYAWIPVLAPLAGAFAAYVVAMALNVF